MPPLSHSRVLLLLLLFSSSAGTSFAKSLSQEGTLAVLIRVQVYDNSDLSPLASASVDVYGNQSALASGTAGADGVVMITFPYHPGTWVLVTASKHGFVTNSAPWHANRIPLYASVSLYLLPQRPATLILFDDVVQVLLGAPGSRNQPWIQFQRKTVRLPPNSTYTELSAVLTTAKSLNSSWLDLTPVAALSAHVFTRNGTTVQVSGPIHISVPLPGDSPVRASTTIPAWWFDSKTGIWIRNGTGYIKKEGTHLTWSFIAPQLGYWVAAVSTGAGGMPLNTSGLRDVTTYHTIFLLAILGSMALLVLILLCLLLYYCRRRCLKPRQQHRKMQVSATLDPSKKDQCTSTSHINLISGGHIETASSNGDMDTHTPILKSGFSNSQDFESSREEFFKQIPTHKIRHCKVNTDTVTRRGVFRDERQKIIESFPMKVARTLDPSGSDHPLLDEYRRSYSSMASQQTMEDKSTETLHRHIVNDNKAFTQDPPSPPPLPPPFDNYQGHKGDGRPPDFTMSQSVDHLARPTSLSHPGQLIFCGSIDHMKDNMYRKMMPTLVIPANYIRLASEYPEQAVGMTMDQQQEMEGIQVQVGMSMAHGLTPQQQQQMQHQASHSNEDPEGRGWAPHPSTGPVRIPVLFNDSTMAQMNGELQTLTEKKLLELGVKPHPRAWFVSLDGRSNSHVRHSYIDLQGNERSRSNDASLDSGVDVNEVKPQRRIKEERDRHGHGSMAYSKLAYMDDTEQSSSESRTAVCSPEDNSLTPLLDESLETRGATIPRRGRSRGNSSRSSNSEIRRDSMTSPEDEMNDQSEGGDDQGENKKSPWQKREERPLMVFNVK